MRFGKPRILLASAAALLAIGAAHPVMSADQASPDPVAATVNGTAISQGTVDRLAQQGVSEGHPDTPETRKAIVDQLALQIVIAQEAVKKGLDQTPEVAEQVNALTQVILARAYVQDFLKNNPVSDDLVKAEYERIKATVTGTEYQAAHILVATESEANDIIATLKEDPGAFAKLAKERSKDAGSKDQESGDLGWLDLSVIAPEDSAPCREQTGQGYFHTGIGPDGVRLSRHPAGRRQADRGAAHRRGQAPAQPADSAATLGKAIGCAQGLGQDRSDRRSCLRTLIPFAQNPFPPFANQEDLAHGRQ